MRGPSSSNSTAVEENKENKRKRPRAESAVAESVTAEESTLPGVAATDPSRLHSDEMQSGGSTTNDPMAVVTLDDDDEDEEEDEEEEEEYPYLVVIDDDGECAENSLRAGGEDDPLPAAEVLLADSSPTENSL
jgi:hypothetical protein